MVNAQLKNTRKKEDIDENLALLCNLRFKIDSEELRKIRKGSEIRKEIYFFKRDIREKHIFQ